jgi:hypothetical protein
VVVSFKDGKVEPGGHCCMKKGLIQGDVLEADLKLDAASLTGTISYKYDGVRKCRVECRILAGHWIDGTVYTEGRDPQQCRGGLYKAGSVPIRKCTKAEYAILRAMQPEGSNGRILDYKPVLEYLKELEKEGKSLPEVPKMKPVPGLIMKK